MDKSGDKSDDRSDDESSDKTSDEPGGISSGEPSDNSSHELSGRSSDEPPSWLKLVRAGANMAIGSFWLCGSFAVLFSIAGLFGQFGWLFDFCSHFKVQSLIVLVWCIPFSLQRGRALLIPWSVGILLSLVPIGWRFVPAGDTVSAIGSSLSVMSINLESVNNKNYAPTVEYIRKMAPDAVALQELGPEAAEYLVKQAVEYPHRYLIPHENTAGMGVLSKHPLKNLQVKQVGINYPLIACEVDTPDSSFMLIDVHPRTPLTWTMWANQLALGDEIARICKESRCPVVLAGDLNATYWSWPFRRLLEITNLKDSSQGYGIQPTWPTDLPTPGLALDHVLYSEGLSVQEHSPGPNIGSDHWPVFVKLAVPQKK